MNTKINYINSSVIQLVAILFWNCSIFNAALSEVTGEYAQRISVHLQRAEGNKWERIMNEPFFLRNWNYNHTWVYARVWIGAAAWGPHLVNLISSRALSGSPNELINVIENEIVLRLPIIHFLLNMIIAFSKNFAAIFHFENEFSPKILR